MSAESDNNALDQQAWTNFFNDMPENVQNGLKTHLNVKEDNYAVSLFFRQNVFRTGSLATPSEEATPLYSRVVDHFSFYNFIYTHNFDALPFVGLALKHPNIDSFKQLHDRSSTAALLPSDSSSSIFLDALFNAEFILEPEFQKFIDKNDFQGVLPVLKANNINNRFLFLGSAEKLIADNPRSTVLLDAMVKSLGTFQYLTQKGVPQADATQIAEKYPTMDVFLDAKPSAIQAVNSNLLIAKAHNTATDDLAINKAQQAAEIKAKRANKIDKPQTPKKSVDALGGLAAEQAALHDGARKRQEEMGAALEQQADKLEQDLSFVQTALPGLIPGISPDHKTIQAHFCDLCKLYLQLPENKLIPAQTQIFNLTSIPSRAKMCTKPPSLGCNETEIIIETSVKFDQFKKQWHQSAQASLTVASDFSPLVEISGTFAVEDDRANIKHEQKEESTKVAYKTQLLKAPTVCLGINPVNLNLKHNGAWLTKLVNVDNQQRALEWLVEFGSHFVKQAHTLGIYWRKTVHQCCMNDATVADVSESLATKWDIEANANIVLKGEASADVHIKSGETAHAIKRSDHTYAAGNSYLCCSGPIIDDCSQFQNISLPNPDHWCSLLQERNPNDYIPIWDLLNELTPSKHTKQLELLKDAYNGCIGKFDSHIANNNLQPIQEFGRALGSSSHSIPCSPGQLMAACKQNDALRVLANAFSPHSTINALCATTRMSPLMVAASCGHTKSVTILLSHPEINIQLQDDYHRKTALDYAFSHSHVDVCELIFDSMRSRLKESSPCPPNYNTCIYNGSQQLSPMAKLIARNLDLLSDLPPIQDQEETRLLRAITVHCSPPSSVDSARPEGDFESLLPIRISEFLQLECRGDNGETAFLRAVRYGQLDVARGLLKLGANVLAKDSEGRSALDIAISAGNCRMVRLLLKTQAFPVDSKFRSNPQVAGEDTALIAAVFKNSVDDVIKYTFAVDAQVNAFNWCGHTPLMVAAIEGHRRCIEILLQHQSVVDNINMKAVRSNRPPTFFTDPDRDINKTAYDLAKNDDCRNLIRSYLNKNITPKEPVENTLGR